MTSFIAILLGVIEGACGAFILLSLLKKRSAPKGNIKGEITDSIAALKALREKINKICGNLSPIESRKEQQSTLQSIEETLNVEKGRVTITYAELETVEGRLRELHEIERELAASGLETQEELKILRSRELDLKTKAESLQSQIAASNERIEKFAGEIATNEELKTEISKIQRDLEGTEYQVSTLRQEIERGNSIYITLKRQYDALDIEYAQLYEKYAIQIEEASPSGGASN